MKKHHSLPQVRQSYTDFYQVKGSESNHYGWPGVSISGRTSWLLLARRRCCSPGRSQSGGRGWTSRSWGRSWCPEFVLIIVARTSWFLGSASNIPLQKLTIWSPVAKTFTVLTFFVLHEDKIVWHSRQWQTQNILKLSFKMHFSDLVGACNRPNNWCSLRCQTLVSSTTTTTNLQLLHLVYPE